MSVIAHFAFDRHQRLRLGHELTQQALRLGCVASRMARRGHDMTVVVPSFKGLPSHSIDGVPVLRFRYAPRAVESLTHDQGAPNKLRNPLYNLLAPPYIVLATQNPIELEGTYPLPEAQMDRFLFKVIIGSPKPDELREIMHRTTGANAYQVQPNFDASQAPAKIEQLKALVREVMVSEPVRSCLSSSRLALMS